MKKIFTALSFLVVLSCFADKALEKDLLSYLERPDDYDVYFRSQLNLKLDDNFNIVRKVLDKSPGYLNKFIASTTIYPTTIYSDKIYCELMQKYILSKVGIERKKAFASKIDQCAGTEYTIELIRRISPSVNTVKLSDENEKLLNAKLQGLENHAAFLNQIKHIAERKEKLKLKVIRYDYVPLSDVGLTEDGWLTDDDDTGQKKQLPLTKERKDVNSTQVLLDKIKPSKEAKNVNISELLQLIAEQGGRHTQDFATCMEYSKHQYAVYDSDTKKIRYLLVFNNPPKKTKKVRKFFLLGFKYDKENNPISHCATEVKPSNKIRQLLVKSIYSHK